MPIDTLGEDVQRVVRNAKAFLSSNQKNGELRQSHLRDLEAVGARVSNEIEERRTRYIAQLESDERTQVDNQWAQLNAKPQFIQANKQNQTNLQIFENLRQINGGAYPRDLSPVLYVIPLVLVGLAEWYVNFATFEATFIPVFAIAGTLLVAAVFAWASHMHGAVRKANRRNYSSIDGIPKRFGTKNCSGDSDHFTHCRTSDGDLASLLDHCRAIRRQA